MGDFEVACRAFRKKFAPGVRVRYQNPYGVETDTLNGRIGTVVKRQQYGNERTGAFVWVAWDDPPEPWIAKHDPRVAAALTVLEADRGL